MGLEGISEFLRKKHPNVIQENHISIFSFKKICVDISGFIYKYMSIYGKNDNKWLQSFINLILLMKTNYINFIPVFDGKPPKEKQEELQSRKDTRNQIKEKVDNLSNDLIMYNQAFDGIDEITKNEVINRLLSILEKIDKNDKKETKNSLLRKYLNTEESKDQTTENKLTDINIKKISDYVEKQKGYFISITSEDIKKVKSLFDIFNINYIQSKSESEQTCCQLVNEGYCDGILSSDTDCIAHRVNLFIFSLDTQTGMVKYIYKDDLLKSLEFDDEEQLTDFGILVGCDYNKGKKIKNIGPVKAHSLIKENKTLENIKEKMGIDIDSIDYLRCRELFHYKLSESEIKIERWINPPVDSIIQYCEENDFFVNYNKIKKVFESKPEILYLEENKHEIIDEN